jgi:hypothetical protein
LYLPSAAAALPDAPTAGMYVYLQGHWRPGGVDGASCEKAEGGKF